MIYGMELHWAMICQVLSNFRELVLVEDNEVIVCCMGSSIASVFLTTCFVEDS